MCGRYFLENTIEMEPFLEKMKRSSLVRRWNDTSAVITEGEIHPTDVVPVIASNQAGKQSVFPMRWGYNGKTLLINAKVETAKEKPTFRDDWKSHRCIVPASYYLYHLQNKHFSNLQILKYHQHNKSKPCNKSKRSLIIIFL